MTKNKMDQEQVEKHPVIAFLKDTVSCLLLAVAVSAVTMSFINVTVVDGHSMDQTLFDGQHMILSKKSYAFSQPERGDIIVAKPEGMNGKLIVKRVIALPGDHLEIRENVTYVNGQALQEDYLPEPMHTADLKLDIPEGKLFVMGDNRNVSNDSRGHQIGLIDMEHELEGKIVAQLPF